MRLNKLLELAAIAIVPLAVALPISVGAQDLTGSQLRASVRPNDSAKVDRSLPWVSEYEQPLVYASWWKEIADCEKLILPTELIKAMHFVQINARSFRRGVMAEALYGFTDSRHLTIYIAQGSVLDKSLITHEIVHQLNYWSGFDAGADSHPPDQFENCGIHTVGPPLP
ncbi:MAG: hypothetical protein M3Z54_05760 [Gemmatimonadota bacterium]|nr:hypothetical protein [Gemmatimonadota bacterium]